MTKSALTGYTVLDINQLKAITQPLETGTPLFVFSDKTWYLYDPLNPLTGISTISSPIGKFVAMPQTFNNDRNLVPSTLSSSTPTTSINFLNQNKLNSLTLSTDTNLQLLNLAKGSEYLLRIIPNNQFIGNITDVITFDNLTSFDIFNTNYQEFIVKLIQLENLHGELVYRQFNNSLLEYVSNSSSIFFRLSFWQDFNDFIFGDLTAVIEGNPAIVRNSLQLNTGRLLFSNTIDLNETNFSFEFYLKFDITSNYGSIISKWNDFSKQFWFRVDSLQNLVCSFNEGSQIVNLTTNLSATIDTTNFIHINVTRFNNIYKLFVNGLLVHSIKSSNFMVNSSANLIVGRLENSTNEGSIAATSFQGRIKDLRLNTVVNRSYNFEKTAPYNAFKPNEVYLARFDKNLFPSPSLISNTSTYPLLASGGRKGTMLDRWHHLQYSVSPSLPNATVEAWIRNESGNSRGTVLYSGDGTNTNWHFGIFDNRLRLQVNNNTIDITGVTNLNNQWNHICFTKSGNDYRIYLNGLLEAQISNAAGLNEFGVNVPLAIKRSPLQDTLEANVNTSLYPSRSHISIDSIRLSNVAIYNGINTLVSNFDIPEFFSLI